MLLFYPMYLIVAEGVPAKTVAEFVKLAKAKPGTLNFGSPGVGSGGHLVAEMFKSAPTSRRFMFPTKVLGPRRPA